LPIRNSFVLQVSDTSPSDRFRHWFVAARPPDGSDPDPYVGTGEAKNLLALRARPHRLGGTRSAGPPGAAVPPGASGRLSAAVRRPSPARANEHGPAAAQPSADSAPEAGGGGADEKAEKEPACSGAAGGRAAPRVRAARCHGAWVRCGAGGRGSRPCWERQLLSDPLPDVLRRRGRHVMCVDAAGGGHDARHPGHFPPAVRTPRDMPEGTGAVARNRDSQSQFQQMRGLDVCHRALLSLAFRCPGP
jgi:hypothetical protein